MRRGKASQAEAGSIPQSGPVPPDRQPGRSKRRPWRSHRQQQPIRTAQYHRRAGSRSAGAAPRDCRRRCRACDWSAGADAVQ